MVGPPHHGGAIVAPENPPPFQNLTAPAPYQAKPHLKRALSSPLGRCAPDPGKRQITSYSQGELHVGIESNDQVVFVSYFSHPAWQTETIALNLFKIVSESSHFNTRLSCVALLSILLESFKPGKFLSSFPIP